ncbi:MAG: 23S rRNA pseudouridine2457 synthase, partial [Shewanella sp.]
RDPRHGPTSWVSITLCEGKNRQIRKMTAAVGFATLRLVRVRIGDIDIATMQAGDVIPLADFSAVLNRGN